MLLHVLLLLLLLLLHVLLLLSSLASLKCCEPRLLNPRLDRVQWCGAQRRRSLRC